MRSLVLVMCLFSLAVHAQVTVQEYAISKGLFAHDV